MNAQAVASTKQRLQRKIAITTILCLFWAGSMFAISRQRTAGLGSETYLYTGVVILAAWAVNTYRTVRRLSDRDYLERAAVAEHDERNIQITYQATRLAATAIMCAAPIAICVLALLNMQQAIDTIAVALASFMLVYLTSWFFISRRS